jgi:hypothetical protein
VTRLEEVDQLFCLVGKDPVDWAVAPGWVILIKVSGEDKSCYFPRVP